MVNGAVVDMPGVSGIAIEIFLIGACGSTHMSGVSTTAV